jgi:Flp pilus assembly protein TadB
MFERLKENILQEKKIISDINSILDKLKDDEPHKGGYVKLLDSLMNNFKLLNNSVPELLKEWSPINIQVKIQRDGKNGDKMIGIGNGKISEKKKKKEDEKMEKVVRVSYVSPSKNDKNFVTLNKGDRESFLKDLRLSERSLTSLEREKTKDEKKLASSLRPNSFAKFSNKFFRKSSEKLTPKFGGVSRDLKKANLKFLMSTYVSMMLMSTSIAFFTGIMIFGVLLILNLSNFIYAWIPFVLSGFTFTAFYLYPASEASSVQKKISQELPFATIHMAAISGSNIEPVKILKIISMSKEYKNIGFEIKKIIAQVDIYGYDLVTSLKNVAQKISNKRLSELFSGIATNIGTGGELKSYLEKKADNFLLDYKLERQKYSDLAGTFMDIYISILIAAPLVLMMMFIVMNVAGLGLCGLSLTTLLFFSILVIILVNILFLIVLNFKQPKV